MTRISPVTPGREHRLGKAWSGTGPYDNTTSANWGVNRNSSTGTLSGYAWSENAGWVNFNPTHSEVTISTTILKFDGYAWAENVGYVHFQNVSPEYFVMLEGGITNRIGHHHTFIVRQFSEKG